MRKWIILLGVLIVVAILGYNYVYQDHRDVAQEKATYTSTASTFSEEFQINPKASETKYLDKIIQLSGKISSVNEKSLTLNNSVFCQFLKPTTNTIINDDNVVIKGRFIGYDDLLEQIKLDQCQIIN